MNSNNLELSLIENEIEKISSQSHSISRGYRSRGAKSYIKQNIAAFITIVVKGYIGLFVMMWVRWRERASQPNIFGCHQIPLLLNYPVLRMAPFGYRTSRPRCPRGCWVKGTEKPCSTFARHRAAKPCSLRRRVLRLLRLTKVRRGWRG